MAWHEPLSKEGRAARTQKSPDYWKYSHLHPAKPNPGHLWAAGVLAGCEVAQVFLADSPIVWLPCALWRAGPGGCKFSVRLRLGSFKICLKQLCKRHLSVPQLLFPLAVFSSSGCCREVVCTAPAGQGDTAWGCLGHCQGFLSSSPMAQLLLYPISKGFFPPEESPDPVDGQSHICGLPLPSPVPEERMECRWPTWCQKLLLATTWHTGFHMGFPPLCSCFGCLCLKGHFKNKYSQCNFSHSCLTIVIPSVT